MVQKYKCSACKIIINEEDLEEGNCPECHNKPKEMCVNDNCTCIHEMTETLAYCKICGNPCCPICGCEDVEQISRVTGYLGAVSGWSAGKAQELKDRVRYDVA